MTATVTLSDSPLATEAPPYATLGAAFDRTLRQSLASHCAAHRTTGRDRKESFFLAGLGALEGQLRGHVAGLDFRVVLLEVQHVEETGARMHPREQPILGLADPLRDR